MALSTVQYIWNQIWDSTNDLLKSRLVDSSGNNLDDGSGNINSKITDNHADTLSTTHQNAVSATGNGTAATVTGYGSIAFQVAGTFTATVEFEGSVDGSNYESIPVLDADGDKVTSTTSTGIFRADISGYQSVQTPVTWTSGTSVTVSSIATPQAKNIDVAAKQYGRNVSVEILANAVSVADGDNTGDFNLNPSGEKKLIIAVAIDKQPWTLYTNSPFNVATGYGYTYPAYLGETSTYSANNPASALLHPLRPSLITTMDQALLTNNMIWDDVKVRVQNNVGDASVATITVTKISVWR